MPTDFEQRLSDTLQELTPEPARTYRRRDQDANRPAEVAAIAPRSHRATGGRRYLAPIAASVAVLAAAGAVTAVVATRDTGAGRHQDRPAHIRSGPSDTSASPLPTGFRVPAGLSNAALPAGHFGYRVIEEFNVTASGKRKQHDPTPARLRGWINTKGVITRIQTGGDSGCTIFARQVDGAFDSPTKAYFASLPTDVGTLTKYFRSHVQGSSSRDEAVFVAVGDSLREANALASPRLRAAMLGMLSRTPGVIVHTGQRDYLGRPAIRADFVDQRIRPGEIQSLYFDPRTFSLTEEREGSNGQPSTPASDLRGSPAYASPAPSRDPGSDVISGAAFVSVVTTERVVTALPKLPANCTHD